MLNRPNEQVAIKTDTRSPDLKEEVYEHLFYMDDITDIAEKNKLIKMKLDTYEEMIPITKHADSIWVSYINLFTREASELSDFEIIINEVSIYSYLKAFFFRSWLLIVVIGFLIWVLFFFATNDDLTPPQKVL